MIADEGCAERGCPMHDSMWTPGVQMVEKKEWQGLTDEEIEAGFITNTCCDDLVVYEHIARATEAKLKEKNT